MTQSRPTLVTRDGLIDDVLGLYGEAIGGDLPGYRGHVYRTFNLAWSLTGYPADARDLAIAAAFHDIGIWSDGTFDYLAPSARRAAEYVEQHHLPIDVAALERVLLLHHKLTPCRGRGSQVAEAFRRADLIDLTFGLVKFGLPSQLIREMLSAFPNAGFHRCLLRVAWRWVCSHPARPLPMLRW
jgi:hypothetical protein